MENKIRIRNDFILAAVILLVAGITFLIFRLTLKGGEYVSVTYDGVEISRYSLADDREVNLAPLTAENYNVLIIKDGEAYISRASCPDGICKGHRAIKNKGESIVCLPNKIVVTITGENDSHDVDVIS